jgi:hypothetical protein
MRMVFQATLPLRFSLPQADPYHTIKVEYICGGTLPEQVFLPAFGCKNYVVASASDSKAVAQEFTKHYSGDVGHLYATMRDQINGGGYCLRHCRKCYLSEDPRFSSHPEGDRPDITIGSLPCQGHSRARFKKGSGPKQGDVADHPGQATIEEFGQYLEMRMPHMFSVEQSKDFLHKIPNQHERHIDRFASAC